MKKVDKDPFSNGSEHLLFESQCCTKCVKDSYWIDKLGRFVNADDKNHPKCAIQRDIMTRMFCTDQIEVRHYFGHAIEDVKWVDFDRREVNGYHPIEIIRHIKKTPTQQIM